MSLSKKITINIISLEEGGYEVFICDEAGKGENFICDDKPTIFWDGEEIKG